MSEPSLQSVGRWKRKIAPVLMATVVIQVLVFFIGLMVPVQRVATLWGKSFEDRQLVLWRPGQALTQIAKKFPEDAKIYFEYPDLLLHWNMIYYFYPRLVTVTMTNGNYRTREAYVAWNERPTEDWLVSNGFTHVLSFKDGKLQARGVKPPPQSQNATVK
jgi:hypothetical protein